MSFIRSLSTGVATSITRSAPLRFILILDLEATCDDSGRIVPKNEVEIIELPTLLYDFHEDKVHATFHEYVRPQRHPILTPLCRKLTGIDQSTVDAADSFSSVWDRYQEFLRTQEVVAQADAVSYLTCGDWDLKTMLPQQLHLDGIHDGIDPCTGALVAPFNRRINLKTSFQKYYGLKYAKGMEGMLRHAKMELEGHHHSGIDDCKNILRIVQRMRRDGWQPWDDLP